MRLVAQASNHNLRWVVNLAETRGDRTMRMSEWVWCAGMTAIVLFCGSLLLGIIGNYLREPMPLGGGDFFVLVLGVILLVLGERPRRRKINGR